MHVFSNSFNNKSKACGWSDAKCLFMYYFTCHAQKIRFIAVLIWFLILGKVEDGGQGVDHCCWRHRAPAAPPPIKYTSSWERSKAFHWRQKCFEIPQHIKKTLGEVPSTLTPLVLRWGYKSVCVHVWGLISIGWAWSWVQTFHLQLILIYTEINIFLNLGLNFH